MAVPYNRLVTKHGLAPEKLKAHFDAETMEKRPKAKELADNIRDIIRGGIERNRRDYRLFKAMDWAYESPFYQVSYTQLRGLLDSRPDDKKVMDTVRNWGLTHLLPDVLDDCGKQCKDEYGNVKKAVNLPVFFNIFVPVCMAYITIRWAKLFNDLDQVPHFKYEPIQFTKENRIRCEMITQMVQRQSMWFDYPSDTKQSILQMLIYGLCINFPREAWYSEKQEDEDGKKKTVREGLRFNMPHPSRLYYDTFHRLSSLNSNSGCEYAGYWSLRRYRDIYNDPTYWNKEKISFGTTSWFDLTQGDFLEQVYPCAMSFPNRAQGGTGAMDRETVNSNTYYSVGNYNNATLETQHFQKLVPKDVGLGDYDCPVWFRFVMGCENTVLYAEPLSFDRIPTYAYDADFNRSRFRSMTLEVMPFQDHISNLMSHWILAVKQNLMNPIFYDKDQLSPTAVQALENLGQKTFSGNLYLPFSGTENMRSRINEKGAFHQPQFARHNTAEIATLINGVLLMLDRMIQVAPQEVGQAASHEQTAEESRIVERNTSTRVSFTASFIKDGNHAKKKMLYDGNMAHSDDDITANISSSLAQTEEEFKSLAKSLGLTIDDGPDFNPNDPQSTHTVSGKKSAMALEEFSTVRDGQDRINTPAIADAMSKIFTAVAGNEALVMGVGVPQLVELLNQIIITSGLPKEFKLRGSNIDLNAGAEEQSKQFSKLIEDFSAQVKKALDESQQQTLAAAAEQTNQAITQVATALSQQVQQVAQVTQQTAEATAQGAQADQQQAAQIEALHTAVKQLTGVVSTMTATITQPPTAAMPHALAPAANPLAPVQMPV